MKNIENPSANFEDHSIAEPDDNPLQDAVEEAGLSVEIPKENTPAYDRLKNACDHYTEAVVNFNYTSKSPNMSTSEVAKQNSEKNRRSVHNQLCVMLLGKTWHETSEDDRRKVSNFAVIVGGRSEYVGTF